MEEDFEVYQGSSYISRNESSYSLIHPPGYDYFEHVEQNFLGPTTN